MVWDNPGRNPWGLESAPYEGSYNPRVLQQNKCFWSAEVVWDNPGGTPWGLESAPYEGSQSLYKQSKSMIMGCQGGLEQYALIDLGLRISPL